MPGRSGRAAPEPVLGRAQGLGIVRPTRPEVARLPGALEVPIDQVVPDAAQPRRNWQHDEGERRLDELVASVREFGILQPLLVRPSEPEEEGAPYQIVAGNRRFVAAQRAGLATVPVVVRSTDLLTTRILQLTENLQRQDLAPLDEARAYQELMDLKQCSPRELGEQLHVSDQHVRLRLRLLGDQTLADAVERRQIAANTARLIQQLPDEEQLPFRERVRLGERLQENDLAAVRARLLAEGAIHPRRTRPPVAPGGPLVPEPARRSGAPPTIGAPADTRHSGVQEAGPDPTLKAPAGIPGSDHADPTQKGHGNDHAPGGRDGDGYGAAVGVVPAIFGSPENRERESSFSRPQSEAILRAGGDSEQREGGQIPFDLMPHSGGAEDTLVPDPLVALLAAADPAARRLLARVAREPMAQIDDPPSMEPALRLAGQLLRLLAAGDAPAATALRMLIVGGYE